MADDGMLGEALGGGTPHAGDVPGDRNPPGGRSDERASGDRTARVLARETLAALGAGRPVDMSDASRHGVFGFNSRDRRSRPFNLLRAQVMKIVQAHGHKIIGVTSPTPNVGKTFVASNLVASLSRIPGQRVVLVDLDLRRGSVAQQFALDVPTGIEAYLAGDAPISDEMVLQVRNSGLTLVPAHPTERSSAELLAGAPMRTLIDALRGLSGQHLVVCDLPPVFANDDVAIVLRQIDAYLMVVEEGTTTARQLRDSLDVLRPATCIGTVLNRYRGPLGGDDYGFGYWSQRNYDRYYS